MKLKPTDRLLDAGCRSGRWALSAASDCAYISGVGLTEDEVATASSAAIQRGASNVSFQWAGPDGPTGNLDLPEGPFDWVVCRCLWHRLQDPRRVMENLTRVLNVPGRMMIAERTGASEKGLREADDRLSHSCDPSHVRTPAAKEIGKVLEDVGLSLEHEQHWEESRAVEDWISDCGCDDAGITRARKLFQEAARKKKTDWRITPRGKSFEFTHRMGMWIALRLH